MKKTKQIKHFFLSIYVISVIFLGIANCHAQQSVTPSSALKSYLNNSDDSYQWQIQDSLTSKEGTIYDIKLTSQTWKKNLWKHQLTIVIPKEVQYNTAMLFITGGQNEMSEPKSRNIANDGLVKAFSNFALQNRAITAILHQTPNQPLYGNKYEDELISYTLHQYKQDKDYEWPLLFPMVKSAVKAMDVIQDVSQLKKLEKIQDFVVSGASKRGWTTWLTGAIDQRVKAIAPMVIDILNMPVSLQYQIESWGDYSVQIQDYVKLGIPQSANSPLGQEISIMVDPYSYKETLTMPKMIFMGTNDEYWVLDNVKNYIDDIPGTNLLHYVPNVGHNLGDKESSINALSAFFASIVKDQKLPEIKWSEKTNKDNVTVDFQFPHNELISFNILRAESSIRDFRKAEWKLVEEKTSAKEFKFKQNIPKEGYIAFYIDFKYQHPLGGQYTVSSRIFLIGPEGLL